MRAIRQKLQSRSGASLFLALLFFLVCLTVGAATLVSATASAGRLRDQRQTQQDYLTVSSAARLLRGQLEGVTFTTVTTVIDGGAPHVDYTLSGLTASGALGSAVESGAEAVFQGRPAASAAIRVAADGFEDTTGQLAMDSGYALTLTLSIPDGGDGRRSPMTLTVPALVQDLPTQILRDEDTSTDSEGNEVTEVTITVIETRIVTWDAGRIEKGIAEGAGT